MRNIMVLIAFLISFSSWAGYVAESKINDCARSEYTQISLCQQAEDESCYLVPSEAIGKCGILKLQDTYGGPRKSVDDCSGEANCMAALAQKSCLPNQKAFADVAFKFVYCMDKVGKELVVDSALKATVDAVRAQQAQTAALIKAGRDAREACDRVLDLIGGFNLLPGRSQDTINDMVETFAEAKSLLKDGRPGAAKAAIQAIPVDGVLVTQPMKDLALQQLSAY